jgi:hypothetical protein
VILIILTGIFLLWSTVNVYAEKKGSGSGILVAQSKEEKKTETKKPDEKKPPASPTANPVKTAAPSKPAASPAASEQATEEPTPQESATGDETTSGEPSAAPTEAPASPTQAPSGIAGILAKFDIKKNIIPIAGGIGGLIVLLIVIMLLTGKKKKHVCERCGKTVLPGMVFCDECSGAGPGFPKQDSLRTETKAAPPRDEVRAPAYTPPPPVDTTAKKKVRPSGRVIAVITIRRGANQGHRFNFYESIAQITVGSDPDCDIVVEEDEEVSARHAVISMGEGSSFYVHDMGNTSGLFVNNDRVKQSGLKSGDVIKMGKTELTFARL